LPVIVASVGIAVVLAVFSGLTLYSMQKPVYQSQPMPSVRVGDPGHNLVGPSWSGNPSPRKTSEDGVDKTSGPLG
jgi:hypothetical protein